MWEIITLIYRALASDDIMVLLKKFLKGQGVDISEIEIYNGIKDIDKWTNPQTIYNALSKAKKEALQDFKKKVNDMQKNLGKEQLTDKQINELVKSGSDDWLNLQSSWIKYGKYQLTSPKSDIGLLTILVQSKSGKWYGPYTYPSVPIEVWNAMKSAKGQNGSGAGTMFWRYWLRKWLPSQIRTYVKKRLAKEKDIYVGQQRVRKPRLGTKAQYEVEKYIRRLQSGYIRTKFGREEMKIGTQQWIEQRQRVIAKRKQAYIRGGKR